MGHDQLLDSMIADGLTCPITLVHMGVTAENVAAKYGISREEQDEFAAESQQKAAAAIEGGQVQEPRSSRSRCPAPRRARPSSSTPTSIRAPDTTAEQLAGCAPAFKPDGGTVTAGNASGINDGAAAVVVMSDAKAKELGLTPLATIRALRVGGRRSVDHGHGAVAGVREGARAGGLRKEEIDLWELNEAFAAQSLGVLRELQHPEEPGQRERRRDRARPSRSARAARACW